MQFCHSERVFSERRIWVEKYVYGRQRDRLLLHRPDPSAAPQDDIGDEELIL